LSDDTKALLKIGFIHDDLTTSNESQMAVINYLFEQNRAAMVQIAKDKLTQAKN